MASMKDIKQRIANVKSTEQIIRAMYTIASTKLHKIRAQLEGVRPMYHDLERQVQALGAHPDAGKNTFYAQRDVQHSLYIVLLSDRGFAGAYNSNVLSKALHHMQDKNEKIITIGAKGYDFFKKQNKNILRGISNLPDSQMYHDSEKLAKWMTQQYLCCEADELFVAYTEFKNVLSYTPSIKQLLPVPLEEALPAGSWDKKYEPDLDTVIAHTIPLYMHMNLFRAFSESSTSEQAARMVSMDAAGKNSSELIEDLTMNYNRQRQAAITQELNEIVGGANI